MANVGRNQLCPCGSGKKAKRCCGIRRGPSEEDLARAFVATQGRQCMPVVAQCARSELVELVDELFFLPVRDLSLLAPLPPILTPELERLARVVIDDDDGDEIDSAMEAVLPAFDTPLVRARLARAVIALRDAGRVGEQLAALALVNLAGRSVALLRASLIQALSIAMGVAKTPSGLVVARR